MFTKSYKNNTESDIFNKIAKEWWSPYGKFKTLHAFNKVRVPYIVGCINDYFNLNGDFNTLNILDVGCGGGLITEELAKLNSSVTGIDTSANAIKVAKNHAKNNNLNITYVHTNIENFKVDRKFNVVLLMEVLEHVDSIDDFLNIVFKVVKEDGMIMFSTINRNLKSLFFAKILAEYVLHWLPKGIHSYNKFIKPAELEQLFIKNAFTIDNLHGVAYNLKFNSWELTNKPSVNYIGYAKNKNK